MSCTDCERCSFDEACAARDKVAPIPTKLDDWMHANGWEWPRAPFTGYVRLCAKCKAEKPDDKRTAYQQAIDQKLKTIEQSMDLHLLSMDLYGVPPEVEVTKVDHEARTVEMRRVGSTDICGKCGRSDCEHLKDFFFRAPTPEELAANEKFAAEFMGRVIPGITCDPFALYRDLLLIYDPAETQAMVERGELCVCGIDDVCPKCRQAGTCATCGEVRCTKNHPEFT